ncbi:conserved Plasmodium protein, unknown function [Plasmodium gallinaceum]|uniref:Uncharacterized protein n=1 Tax=Plasmodium gallinaceum TaxID=5849 RepID=A0A1J1GT18_PLAGA|nr:conserved Plasmodium protein, unknown function [Plasmodium gallinaceum]CRG95652.1 conserved Plasmodium protein, unknown function [Plasmodium gallinaceum]
MKLLKSILYKVLKKNDNFFHFSKLLLAIKDPFIFFFLCLFLFVLTSLITYIYCLLKSYKSNKDMRIHNINEKSKLE